MFYASCNLDLSITIGDNRPWVRSSIPVLNSCNLFKIFVYSTIFCDINDTAAWTVTELPIAELSSSVSLLIASRCITVMLTKLSIRWFCSDMKPANRFSSIQGPARLISLFVLVLFVFCDVAFEHFAHPFLGICHSCYPTPWDFFAEFLMTSTAVRGARGNSQSMGFYLLDIFIRRLLVRLGPDLFGAFSLITTSLREHSALSGRSVLCVSTVVG